MSRYRVSTLIAILLSTCALCKAWLEQLVSTGLVTHTEALQVLDSKLDIEGLQHQFDMSSVSWLKDSWACTCIQAVLVISNLYIACPGKFALF